VQRQNGNGAGKVVEGDWGRRRRLCGEQWRWQ